MSTRLMVASAALVAIAGVAVTDSAVAEEAAPVGRAVDRAVVRFTAPETGGVRSPRFIFERMLAFEARLEALADPAHGKRDGRAYRERHVRAALERHIAETLLASSRIVPEPTEREVTTRAAAARRSLLQRIGGEQHLTAARTAEGLDRLEVLRILRRRARASLYLDRMVTPMLRPSEAELRRVHGLADSPFRSIPFQRARRALARWYVNQRLTEALEAYYRNARARLNVTILHPAKQTD